MITPLPGAMDLKPGSATRPFFGVQPAIVDNMGEIQDGACEGNLVIVDSCRAKQEHYLAIMTVLNRLTFQPLKACTFQVTVPAVMRTVIIG